MTRCGSKAFSMVGWKRETALPEKLRQGQCCEFNDIAPSSGTKPHADVVKMTITRLIMSWLQKEMQSRTRYFESLLSEGKQHRKIPQEEKCLQHTHMPWLTLFCFHSFYLSFLGQWWWMYQPWPEEYDLNSVREMVYHWFASERTNILDNFSSQRGGASRGLRTRVQYTLSNIRMDNIITFAPHNS